MCVYTHGFTKIECGWPAQILYVRCKLKEAFAPKDLEMTDAPTVGNMAILLPHTPYSRPHANHNMKPNGTISQKQPHQNSNAALMYTGSPLPANQGYHAECGTRPAQYTRVSTPSP